MKNLIYILLLSFFSVSASAQNYHYALNLPEDSEPEIEEETNCELNNLAIEFDGNDDFVKLPDINLSGDFTIEFWANLEGEITYHDGAFGQETRGPDINFNDGRARIYIPTEDPVDVIYANTKAELNEWNHFSFVRKGNQLTLFINGVLDKTLATSWSGDFPIQAIGRGNAGFFEGKLDEIRIWKVARSHEEITHNFYKRITPTPQSLLLYYDFNEGDNQKVVDLSGNGRDAVLGSAGSSNNDDPASSTDYPEICNGTIEALGTLSNNSYELKKASTTSAGVFSEDGALVKTLWNNREQEAGTYPIEWNRKDDGGNTVPGGNYTIKIITNNLVAEWEGPVGNNSTPLTGEGVQTSYEQLRTMTINGEYAYVAAGFNEGKAAQWKIRLDEPNTRIPIKVLKAGIFGNGQETEHSATDGETVYYGGYDTWGSSNKSFIFGIDPTEDSFQNFSYGNPYTTAAGGDTYASVISLMTENTKYDDIISGMAVQRNGKYLYVSYLKRNEIRVFHKTTGELIRTLTINDPKLLHIDSNGEGSLWIQNKDETVEKYRINEDGSITSQNIRLEGSNKVHAIGANHSGTILAIADGLTQTIKRFSTENGELMDSFGQEGGYATNPTIEDDKFYFSDSRDDNKLLRGAKTFIKYEEDGSYWVGDTHNYRTLHFSSNDKLLDKIEYQGEVRAATVDPNDPKRVFADYMEFEVDYSKPLNGRNGSWKTVRNWRYHTQGYENWIYKLRFVYTLSNGRTYAQINTTSGDGPFTIFELDPEKGLRNTGIDFPKGGAAWVLDWFLQPDGSLRRYTLTGPEDNRTVRWEKAPLLGFDENNNPEWGALEPLAVLNNQDKLQPYHRYGIFQNSPPVPDISENDVIITYESHHPDLGTTGHHLGGIRVGSDEWLWKAMPSTPEDYTGPFPTDGRYDIGNGVHYPGGPAVVIDDLIFAGYHGEFWKNSTTNMWYIYRDDGLMLKLFGVLGTDVVNESTPYGSAGNVLSANVVKVGDAYYLYHADENAHGGTNRWKISNLESIKEKTVSISIAD